MNLRTQGNTMETHKIIGVLLIVLSVIILLFGVWIKVYNDNIAQFHVNETGSCYLPDGTCLHSTSDSIMYSSIGIAFLVFLASLYFILHKDRQNKIITKKVAKRRINEKVMRPNVLNSAPKTLNAESKKVFEIITQANGAILQGEIVAKSGMDKVKVSRVLDKLEMQGLVERRRHGMSNLVLRKA